MRGLYAKGSIRNLCRIVSLEFGRSKLEDRPRAKSYLRRIAGVTRPVAEAPQRSHAPEPAPTGTLSLGVEASTLGDRDLFKREIKDDVLIC